MSWLEAFYGVFFQPALTFRFLARQKPVAWAVLTNYAVYFFNWLLEMASGAPAIPGQSSSGLISGVVPEIGTQFMFFGFFAGILLLGLSWFANTAVIDVIAQFFGGQGQGVELFVTLGFISLPGLVGGLANLLVNLLRLPQALTFFIWLAVLIWGLVLIIIAVREIYHFSPVRAAVTVLLPLAVLFLSMIVLVLALVVLLAPSLQNLISGVAPF